MAAPTPDRAARAAKHTGPQRPAAESLLVTGDDRLAETITPLAAAAGHPLHRVRGPGDAETRWRRAPLVIVGADAAADCLAHGLPERRDLILCTTLPWIGADPTGTSMLWPLAIKLQADHVIAVPEATEWLLDRFTRTARDTTHAPVAAVVAGHGGAGASTLALAGATAAARDGKRVVLIDLDTTGGGIDTAAGLDAQPGWRWPSLASASGQLEPERLLSGLPQRDGLHLIGPDPRDRTAPEAAALERVLHAARIGADLVLIDLPRTRTEAAARAAAAAT
ncbi:septum site-determining protein Ssd, partial [Glycomyces tenuis]